MNELPTDAPLEAALRAVTTPPLAERDRAAIAAVLRAAAAAPATVPAPRPAAAPRGGAGIGLPLGVALIGAGLLAAGLLARRTATLAPPDAHSPAAPAVATVVRRAGDGAGLRAGGAGAGATAAAASRATPTDGADRPTSRTVPAVAAAIAPPPGSRIVAEVTADAPASTATQRPTATPGPVLPATATTVARPPDDDRGRPPDPIGVPVRPQPTASPTDVPIAAPSATATAALWTGIAGRVRLDGAPAALAAVRAVAADGDDGRFVVGAAGADGAYLLQLPPGRWWVVAAPDGAPAQWWPGAADAAGAQAVVVVDGALTAGIDFDIEPSTGTGRTMGR